MRTFTMQDRSDGKVNRTDEGLNIQQVFEMTDYTAYEMDAICGLEIGKTFFIGKEGDISVERTS